MWLSGTEWEQRWVAIGQFPLSLIRLVVLWVRLDPHLWWELLFQSITFGPKRSAWRASTLLLNGSFGCEQFMTGDGFSSASSLTQQDGIDETLLRFLSPFSSVLLVWTLVDEKL